MSFNSRQPGLHGQQVIFNADLQSLIHSRRVDSNVSNGLQSRYNLKPKLLSIPLTVYNFETYLVGIKLFIFRLSLALGPGRLLEVVDDFQDGRLTVCFWPGSSERVHHRRNRQHGFDLQFFVLEQRPHRLQSRFVRPGIFLFII